MRGSDVVSERLFPGLSGDYLLSRTRNLILVDDREGRGILLGYRNFTEQVIAKPSVRLLSRK
jgi:hypothetical protein